jgi:hypothetical protein
MLFSFKIVRIAAGTSERESFALICNWVVIVTRQRTATAARERTRVRVECACIICILRIVFYGHPDVNKNSLLPGQQNVVPLTESHVDVEQMQSYVSGQPRIRVCGDVGDVIVVPMMPVVVMNTPNSHGTICPNCMNFVAC